MVCYAPTRGVVVRNLPFDSRWLILILLLLFVLNARGLAGVVLLAVGAGWAIQAGLGSLRISAPQLGGTKVTYWRGQRIETRLAPTQRVRSIPFTQVAIGVFYLLIGAGLAYTAVVLFLRFSNLA
jgi:hypothetical protein